MLYKTLPLYIFLIHQALNVIEGTETYQNLYLQRNRSGDRQDNGTFPM